MPARKCSSKFLTLEESAMEQTKNKIATKVRKNIITNSCQLQSNRRALIPLKCESLQSNLEMSNGCLVRDSFQ